MPAFLLPLLGLWGAIPDWLKKALGILIVLAAVFAAGDQRGKRVARAQCEAQAQRAQKAADAQDLQAEREGRAQDLEITDTLTRQKKVDDEKIIALQKQLSTGKDHKGNPCVYDKSTADPDEPAHRGVRN